MNFVYKRNFTGLIHLTVFVVIGLLSSISARAIAEEYLVVVNSSAGVSELDRKQVREIYLGTRSYWENSTRIRPALMAESSEVQEFLDENLGKSEEGFKSFWRRKLFAGKGIPPVTFENREELLKFVSSQSGAIGVVSKGDVPKTLQVLKLN